MIEYIKFWLAHEITDLLMLLLVLAVVGIVVGLYVAISRVGESDAD